MMQIILGGAGMSSEEPEVDLVSQVTREVRLMSSFDALLSQAIAERVGMHSTDIETLDLLNVLGPMTAGRLAELTGLSTGATTRLVDRLVRAEYVERRADPGDRRRVIIAPMDANLETVGDLYRPLTEKLTALWSSFSPAELKVILRFVQGSNTAVSEVNASLRNEFK
jgi:DNA-binding MarR family transcriptional regulator